MNGEKQNAGDGGDAGGQGGPAGSGKPAPSAPPGIKPIPLFKVAGIDVSLHPAWFVVAVIELSWRKNTYHSPVWNVVEYLALFAIVLLHEFGHAFACRSTGGKADSIMLWPLGGVAYVQPPPRPGAVLWSIAAGPLVNVALLPVTWFLFKYVATSDWASDAPDLLQCAYAVMWINIGLLIFNMIPVYPLDGGQIVQSLLWFVIGRANSLLVVTVIGFIASCTVIGVAAYSMLGSPDYFNQLWFMAIGVFMLQRSVSTFKYARNLKGIEKMRRVEGFACPGCGEKPFAEEIWLCDECKNRFSPFVTGIKCPHCGKIHEKVRCPFCGELSETERWRR